MKQPMTIMINWTPESLHAWVCDGSERRGEPVETHRPERESADRAGESRQKDGQQ